MKGLSAENQTVIRLMTYCGIPVKRMGILGVNVRKMKTLTLKMETVTLRGKDRWNVT